MKKLLSDASLLICCCLSACSKPASAEAICCQLESSTDLVSGCKPTNPEREEGVLPERFLFFGPKQEDPNTGESMDAFAGEVLVFGAKQGMDSYERVFIEANRSLLKEVTGSADVARGSPLHWQVYRDDQMKLMVTIATGRGFESVSARIAQVLVTAPDLGLTRTY